MYLHIFFWHDVRANGEDKANPVLLSSKYQIWKDVKKYRYFYLKKYHRRNIRFNAEAKGLILFFSCILYFELQLNLLLDKLSWGFSVRWMCFKEDPFICENTKGETVFLLSFWNIEKRHFDFTIILLGPV